MKTEPSRRLRYNVATSLDGFIAPPDGSTCWIKHDPAIDFAALYAEFDTFVMGRKTYECMFSAGAQNPLLKQPKESILVFSRNLKPEDHPAVTVVADGLVSRVAELKAREGGRDIWLMGGAQLAGPLLDAGLLDSVEAAMMPVLLGKGTRMVRESPLTPLGGFRLELAECRPLRCSGIVLCKYNVSRGMAASLGEAMMFG
ncbi:riboflavin biosynthesis protein domain-containing protein [Colletotrichum musicola]|uniref:2,5-diamino-6-ribosylamino-4(3H)-pyrimidinone 5'-phosphate reductase n=1 Tax=Colletotrichum musicola TaxID=2175873 RepID=A0A8H6JXA4_9PEZI|nr:riboflavin biosynthesis protein domain-containing protein [Colletotrichum musicola]